MAYRALFRAQLDRAEIDDIRLALNQSQPLGNERFYAKIEKVTGVKRKAKPRGRPRREVDMSTMAIKGQGKLELGEMRAWPSWHSVKPLTPGKQMG